MGDFDRVGWKRKEPHHVLQAYAHPRRYSSRHQPMLSGAPAPVVKRQVQLHYRLLDRAVLGPTVIRVCLATEWHEVCSVLILIEDETLILLGNRSFIREYVKNEELLF